MRVAAGFLTGAWLAVLVSAQTEACRGINDCDAKEDEQALLQMTRRQTTYDAAAAVAPSVTTSCGKVTGLHYKQGAVVAYQGIPFGVAERWQPGKLLQDAGACWSGTFNATQTPDQAQCLQASGPTKMSGYPWSDKDKAVGKESSGSAHDTCLNAFIYANSSCTSTPPCPVLVWFYGGSLVSGSAGGDHPTPAHFTGFVQDYRVVVVSVNYRLDVFGFLAGAPLESADERGNTSGNYGILDQQLGLQWVRSEIVKFGGDPGSITIGGQSSGGTSTLVHFATPSSRDLYDRAISLSGSPNITMDKATKYAQDAEIIRYVCPHERGDSEILACLRAASPVDLMNASYVFRNQGGGMTFPMFKDGIREPGVVYVDGVTVVEPVKNALQKGLVDKPFLLSAMLAESDLTGSEWNIGPVPWYANGQLPNGDYIIGDAGVREAIPRFIINSTVLFARGEQKAQIQKEFRAFLSDSFDPFGQGLGEEVSELYASAIEESISLAYFSIQTDITMTCPTLNLASAAGSSFASPVYPLINNMSFSPDCFWHFANESHSKTIPRMSWPPQWPSHISDINVVAAEPELVGTPGYHLAPCTTEAFFTPYRNAFFDFIRSSEIPGWSARNSVSGQNATNIFEPDGSHVTVEDYKAAVCEFWKAKGFGGQEFSWSD